jgi:hypothetical protein
MTLSLQICPQIIQTWLIHFEGFSASLTVLTVTIHSPQLIEWQNRSVTIDLSLAIIPELSIHENEVWLSPSSPYGRLNLHTHSHSYTQCTTNRTAEYTYLERVAICSPWFSPVAYVLEDTSNPESNSITHLRSPSFGEMYPM